MLADKPSMTLLNSIRATARAAYRAAGVTLPAILAAQPKTTTTTTRTTTSGSG
jgi:hypothetical protein